MRLISHVGLAVLLVAIYVALLILADGLGAFIGSL